MLNEASGSTQALVPDNSAPPPVGGTSVSGPIPVTGPVLSSVSRNPAPILTDDYLQALIDEMRVKDFDSIRFATYRTACKLRFVQSKTNVHLVDIWNMIESFRENGLNAMPTSTNLKISRLELLLTSIFHNLNKRLPPAQHVDTDRSIATLLSFLLGVYDRQNVGRLTIFSIKVALATLCAGKLVDKLRYIFSQISDATGLMEYDHFTDYLQQVLALPSAVFEAPTFGFSESALAQCFKRENAVTLNQFLDTIISDVCPACLMWLPLLHRMTAVEHVYHPVVCDACQVRSFTGFRYKCQRCANYQLCQSCFWRGRTSQSHSNEHEMKEYSSYKSPTKQLAHSIQKSLQCMPIQQSKTHKTFPEKPQRPLDLANIVPITPTALRQRQQLNPLTDWISALPPGQYGNENATDDEHKLIARYAAKLAGRTVFPSMGRQPQRTSAAIAAAVPDGPDDQALIARLEEENNEMLREMAILEQQQTLNANNALNGQLSGLRERTAELEARMREKQQLRHQLMQQLQYLMAQLNNPQNGMSHRALSSNIHTVASLTAAAGGPFDTMYADQLGGVGGMVSTAFRSSSGASSFAQLRAGSVPAAQLQGDLLQAAGAITTNMSNLVQELDQVTEEDSNISSASNVPATGINGPMTNENIINS